MKSRGARAFTLVEILIVVVILGILSAIVVPQFSSATDEAQSEATRVQLTKLRNTLAVYYVRNHSKFPTVAEGDGTWGEIMDGDYMHVAPNNGWVGPANGKMIKFGVGPDASYQTEYGWIFNPATGDVWAGGYDSADHPLPKS